VSKASSTSEVSGCVNRSKGGDYTRVLMTTPDRIGAALRIDKWLWFVRFFRSRSLASAAVDGGRVHLNGARVKASHAVRVGDRLEITREHESWDIRVLAIASRRGPATEAALCYEESPESKARREGERARRKLAGGAPPRPPKRPDKRGRRELLRLLRGR
jgi:ribosome-associated heat shock protein Hsp15